MTEGQAEAPAAGPFEEQEKPGGRLRQVGVGLLVGAVIVAGLYFLARPGGSGTGSSSVAGAPQVGQPAPAVQAMGLDGQTISLAQFRGHPVWINFWATWCPPCKAEMPEMEKLYRERQAQGLTILAISVGEDPRTVKDFVSQAGYSFPILLDPDERVSDLYRVTALPTHVFVDANGVVRDFQLGGLPRNLMLTKLGKVM